MQSNRRGLRSLPVQITIGLVTGVVVALIMRQMVAAGALEKAVIDGAVANIARPIGGIFLNFMFMVIIPLIFSSLALGVAGMGDLRTVGSLGARILAGTILLTGAGVAIGLTMVNIVRPGEGLPEEARMILIERTDPDGDARVARTLENAENAKPLSETIVTFFSRNPIEDAANLFTPNPNYRGGGIIAFLFFSLIVGLAMIAIGQAAAEPFAKLLESIQALSMAVLGFAMRLAPLGVAALIFTTTADVGTDLFGILGKYITTVIVALLIHLFGTYTIALLVARRNPWRFFMQIREVIITAFSTSSSNATLPTALRVAQENVGLPRTTSSFVLTVGATGNQNGTALFEGITVLFLAQFYGIDLGPQEQFTVILMSILAGVGTAGVPGGSIPLIAILLGQVGIPPEGIGIILGVDRLLDMSRTTINVVGDMVLAAVVSPKTAANKLVE